MTIWQRLKSMSKRGAITKSRATQADVYPHHRAWGIGQDWRPESYGEYITKSVPIYAAIRVRAEALARVPWMVRGPSRRDGHRELLAPDHPLREILDRPNQTTTGSELRRATEINLCLWGTCFWTIYTDGGRQPDDRGPRSGAGGRPEIATARPDRMRVLPGRGNAIRGYLYQGAAREVAYLPEEVELFRFFNPLQDLTGLSPVAPLRLSADMGYDALRYNRNTFRNGAMPDYVLLADEMLTDQQAEEFYKRWEKRFQGPDRAHRPAIRQRHPRHQGPGFLPAGDGVF